MDVNKGEPTPGLTYDPNNPRYWDKQALAGEVDRIFEICHGCRLCSDLCPSFSELFHAAGRHDGDVRAFTKDEQRRVNDTCYQCKRCYLQCPYTPDRRHPFQLDFPRLLMRFHAVERAAEGIGMREKILARPEEVSHLAGLTADFSNRATRQPLLRKGLEVALGIHHQKLLPEFHAETLEDWLRKQPQPAGDRSQAVLFATCFVNHNAPEIGRDAVEVFSKNGVSLSCPEQNCCGMPALEAGDVELAKALAEANVESLAPHAEAGKKILAINPACSYMLRKEYVNLVGGNESMSAATRKVADSIRDLCEFLFERQQEGHFNRDFQSTPGRIAYHLPCRLKAHSNGACSRELMSLIPGAEVTLVDQCSAHDGTWAMKKEFFPLSMLAGKKAFDEMQAAEAGTLASDCPLAAIQFEQAIGTRPMHPVQVLARAYRPGGFPTPVPETNEPG